MSERGRPAGGIKFDAKTLVALPEEGSVGTFARILGITTPTVRSWIWRHHCPHRLRDGKFILLRDELTDWLQRTNRLSPVDMVDLTSRVDKLSPEAREFLRVWSSGIILSGAFINHFINVLEHERGASNEVSGGKG